MPSSAQVELVVFKAVPRDARVVPIRNHLVEKLGYLRVGFRATCVDVVRPESSAVVLGGLAAEVAVGHVDFVVAIVVEVRRGHAPRPPGARHLLRAWGHAEPGVLAPEVKPVAKTHSPALVVVLGVLRPPEAEVVKAARRGRTHAHHVHVEAAIGVVVAKDVGHAKGRCLADGLSGDIGKGAGAVVVVQVDASEVADD